MQIFLLNFVELYLHCRTHSEGENKNIVDFLMYNFEILFDYLLNYMFQYNYMYNLNNIDLLYFHKKL